MAEPVSGGLSTWIIGTFLAPFAVFAAWVGKIHMQVNRNTKDIEAFTQLMRDHVEDDKQMHERIATIETDIKHLVKWTDKQK